ncbi:MAG: hypothetical protein P4L67_04760 [Candidatus Pacebacteria bacterium]|nr:hypothetical protein [Candidatus Paceibacterota bacterium]
MASSLHEVDFGSLAILDAGSVNAELKSRLSLVSKDCQERPGDAKARTVTVEIIFEPVVDQNGYTTDVKTRLAIKSKLPAYESKPYSMGMRRRGNQATFVFNENSLGDVSQGTLDLGDDE